MQNLRPSEIVKELDRYIVGQHKAKKAVAIALRNRWRRQQVPEELRDEIVPKNIIMMGPTGVGKTEIARRLAKLTQAPFIKVEASKFTEVGYVGRDVESMIRDLTEISINLVKSEERELVREAGRIHAEERLLDLLLPPPPKSHDFSERDDEEWAGQAQPDSTREKLRAMLREGKLDDREVELTVTLRPQTQVMFANMGLDQMDPDMANMFEKLIPEQHERRKVTVAEARRILVEEETDKLLDREKITQEAIARTENAGIIFLDEIDKIATPGGGGGKGGVGGAGSDWATTTLVLPSGAGGNTRSCSSLLKPSAVKIASCQSRRWIRIEPPAISEPFNTRS